MNKLTKILLSILIYNFVNGITSANSDNFTLPHSFNAGTTISASHMNENLNFLKPYLVKSNGTPIGIYHLSDMWEHNGKLFFNGKYRSAVDQDGKIYGMGDFSYEDSNCSIPISFAKPGVVFRIPDKNLSYIQQNNNMITVYKDVPYYIPFDAQPIFNDSDIGSGKYYRYDLWSDPPSCAEQTLDTWSVKSYYLIQNDYNVTGIQNSYATPITVDK